MQKQDQNLPFYGELRLSGSSWLYAMCQALFREHGIPVSSEAAHQMRAFDATIVSKPGPTGSLWGIRYSVRLPSFGCDFFKLTSTKGTGTVESFKQFPVQSGDYILADRGYVTVRVTTGALHFETKPEVPFHLLAAVESITDLGAVGQRNVMVPGNSPVSGRVCVLRKTEEAAQKAVIQIQKTAQRNGKTPMAETFVY